MDKKTFNDLKTLEELKSSISENSFKQFLDIYKVRDQKIYKLINMKRFRITA